MKLQSLRKTIQLIAILFTGLGFLINFQLVIGIFVVTSFIAGVFYCGWICPFGTLQELMTSLGKKFGIKQVRMPKVIQNYLKYSRYIFATLFMLLTFDFIFQLLGLDPRSNLIALLTGNSISYISVSVLISFLLISLVFERPFCNYFCMEGAKYGLMSSFRFFTLSRNDKSCINCKKCDHICPMQIEISKYDQVTSLQCVNCLKCASSCPVENTLVIKKRKYKKMSKRSLVIGVVAILIASSYFIINAANHKDENTNYTTIQSVDETVDNTLPVNYKDGIYTGSGMGFRGEMTIEVTVENQLITQVKVSEHQDDRKWYNRAKDLLDTIVKEQSANIDTVSGATYSSQGILEGAKNALKKAKE